MQPLFFEKQTVSKSNPPTLLASSVSDNLWPMPKAKVQGLRPGPRAQAQGPGPGPRAAAQCPGPRVPHGSGGMLKDANEADDLGR